VQLEDHRSCPGDRKLDRTLGCVGNLAAAENLGEHAPPPGDEAPKADEGEADEQHSQQ
jgi:hypothetical protein